jgi:asparagine synthase (glutamine-hydrolysing)
VCGLAGLHDYRGGGRAPEPAVLAAMGRALAHRGPDGGGRHVEGPVGLVHRRLAIIDLSPAADQPMASADGKVRLVYNGELYNYRELKAELRGLGHAFATTSDTEVLLEAYRAWGLECVHRLRGIFAFALWDAARGRLWLVRDHLGVKPLFYADSGGVVAFASELEALAPWPGLDRAPDLRALDCFFTFSYIPAPLTRWRGARQLLPGQWLLAEGGRLSLRKYWDLDLAVARPEQADEEEAAAGLEEVVDRAVRRQMVADVPLGVFLSSGVDSFAVARAMRRGHSGPVTGFSIGFDQASYNELPGARRAAQALGVELVSQVLRPSPELAGEVAARCREGFADSSSLALYLLSRFTSRRVKVALGGDGGDELLAGYDTHALAGWSRLYRRLPAFLRGLLARAARALPDTGRRYSLHQKARRFTFGAGQGPWRDHAAWRVIFTPQDKARLYTPEMRRELAGFDPLELYAEPMRRAAAAGQDPLHCLLYADLTFYLPNDMLVKVDRMSMAHGLEARVPLLDLEVVEHAWRLPARLKLWRGEKKRVLRRSIARHYPPELRRAPKRGFNVPPELVPRPVLGREEGRGVLAGADARRLDLYQAWTLYVFSRMGD